MVDRRPRKPINKSENSPSLHLILMVSKEFDYFLIFLVSKILLLM